MDRNLRGKTKNLTVPLKGVKGVKKRAANWGNVQVMTKHSQIQAPAVNAEPVSKRTEKKKTDKKVSTARFKQWKENE